VGGNGPVACQGSGAWWGGARERWVSRSGRACCFLGKWVGRGRMLGGRIRSRGVRRATRPGGLAARGGSHQLHLSGECGASGSGRIDLLGPAVHVLALLNRGRRWRGRDDSVSRAGDWGIFRWKIVPGALSGGECAGDRVAGAVGRRWSGWWLARGGVPPGGACGSGGRPGVGLFGVASRQPRTLCRRLRGGVRLGGGWAGCAGVAGGGGGFVGGWRGGRGGGPVTVSALPMSRRLGACSLDHVEGSGCLLVAGNRAPVRRSRDLWVCGAGVIEIGTTTGIFIRRGMMGPCSGHMQGLKRVRGSVLRGCRNGAWGHCCVWPRESRLRLWA